MAARSPEPCGSTPGSCSASSGARSTGPTTRPVALSLDAHASRGEHLVAYEFRQPANYASGLLKNAAAVSDTAIVSDDFIASLATGLSNSTYVPITLQDPAAKTYEIVWV